MMGLFGLGFAIVFASDERISWQMVSTIAVVSLALLYLAYSRPWCRSWIEFGDRLRLRDLSGIHTYDWCEVSEISFISGDEGDDTRIELTNGKILSVDVDRVTLQTAATALLTCLDGETPKTRQCVVLALNRLATMICYDGASAPSEVCIYHPSWQTEMRMEIESGLASALEDSDVNVRAAATDAIDGIQSRIKRIPPERARADKYWSVPRIALRLLCFFAMLAILGLVTKCL
jgi:hypothetical protein